MNYDNFNLNFLLNLSHVIFERLCIYGTYIATSTTSNNNNELKNILSGSSTNYCSSVSGSLRIFSI